MASFDGVTQYLCHHCNNIFSPLPSPPSSNLLCPNCNGDSFEQLLTPIPFNTQFQFRNNNNNNNPFSNILLPEIAAAGGVCTAEIKLEPLTISQGGQPIGVTNLASSSLRMSVSDLTNGKFQQQLGQLCVNAVLNSGVAPASGGEGNEYSGWSRRS